MGSAGVAAGRLLTRAYPNCLSVVDPRQGRYRDLIKQGTPHSQPKNLIDQFTHRNGLQLNHGKPDI
jgi:hypothetical protein